MSCRIRISLVEISPLKLLWYDLRQAFSFVPQVPNCNMGSVILTLLGSCIKLIQIKCFAFVKQYTNVIKLSLYNSIFLFQKTSSSFNGVALEGKGCDFLATVGLLAIGWFCAVCPSVADGLLAGRRHWLLVVRSLLCSLCRVKVTHSCGGISLFS